MSVDAVRSVPLRDLGTLALAARVLLYAQAVLAAVAVFLVARIGTGLEQDDAGYAAVAGIQTLVYLGGAVVVLCWIHRATANTHALGAQGLSVSPGWAVGYYFIPIANLFLPLQSMRETWKASTQPRDWEIVRSPAIIGWWWAFWILSCLTGAIAFRLTLEPDTFAGSAKLAGQLGMVSDASAIFASLLLATIIGRISARQRDLSPADGTSARPEISPAGPDSR